MRTDFFLLTLSILSGVTLTHETITLSVYHWFISKSISEEIIIAEIRDISGS